MRSEYDDRLILVESEEEALEPIKRLSRDLIEAASTLPSSQVRFLVDEYYRHQDNRKRSSNQIRAADVVGEPHALLDFFLKDDQMLEANIKRTLDAYTESRLLGRWCRSIPGIGPVITAGLMAHTKIEECPTVGHLWRYFGLDPSDEWLGTDKAKALVKDVMGPDRKVTPEHIATLAMRTNSKPSTIKAWDSNSRSLIADFELMTQESLAAGLARRPWNAKAKTLCWKVGQSFLKICNRQNDIYGKVYVNRKVYEIEKNERGDYAEQAAAKLARYNIGKSTEAYKYYIQGKLPPAHILARSLRYSTKLFISHFHHVAFEIANGMEPPKPYILSREEFGHSRFISPPNWPLEEEKEQAA